MTTRGRTPVIPTGVEVALAFCAGVASFALLAVTLAVSDSDLLAVALGVASVGAIVAITRVWGVAYAVPAAMAGLVAYDWFQFPPTHPREFPSSGDLANLLVYVAVAVLVGVVAAHAGRRAVSSEQARGLLAEEQAALRRVATLVAQGVPPSELFGTVAEELGRLLGTDLAGMLRYETDDTVCVVAAWAASGEQPEAGGRRPLDEAGLATTIRTTGRPARIEDPDGHPAGLALRRDERAIRSSVGSPIVVERRLWGVLAVHSSRAEPLPADTESRVKEFTDLVATAISNTEARAEVGRLANEQAALRRVATLVAQESTPAEVFAAVAEEVGRRFEIDDTAILRYERDGTATAVAEWGEHSPLVRFGSRVSLDGDNVTAQVLRTGRPARIDDYSRSAGALAGAVRDSGLRSVVGSPIAVDGRLWGVIVAGSRGATPLSSDTEARIGEFTELVATAISNIQARSDLAASRARIVAATDEERRRVVRDLHDGAQQRLVHTVVTLKLAQRALRRNQDAAPALVAEALQHAEVATGELRELSHGILPSVLTRGGLRAGVEALAMRMPVPVEVGVAAERLPAAVEATAYFVVAEALTNVAKHAHAGRAAVTARVEQDMLRVHVRDDGVGGARPDGSGLVGLADRLAVLDGGLRVESPTDGGTLVAATIPVGSSGGGRRA